MAKKQAAPLGWQNRIIGEGVEAPDQLLANPQNWRIHPKHQQDALSAVLDNIGWVQRVIVNKRTSHIVDGHLRVSLAISRNEPSVPVVYVDLSEDEERAVLATIDPLSAMAATDSAKLAELLESVQIDDAALEAVLRSVGESIGGIIEPVDTPQSPTLADRFIVPPFSVLDARQGYWQERKRQWLSIGIQSEIGRGDVMPSGVNSVYSGSSEWSGYRGAAHGETMVNGKGPARKFAQDLMRGEHVVGGNPETASLKGGLTWATSIHPYDKTGEARNSRRAADQRSNINDAPALPHWATRTGTENMASGTSIFDPVLCELAYRWFTPPAAHILDPFAGGSVRGIVASKLGRRYTGIDLRAEQIEANEAQAAAITPDNLPRWIQGDSQHVSTLAPAEYDFVFSCPPYFDLEIYSDDPADLSNMTYEQFAGVYRQIIAAVCAMLKPERFACFVVGDVRDKRGNYRDFPGLTIEAFQAAGLSLYNEAILVTSVGSLPIRVGKQMESGRKLGKTHQNVLVFVKGDGKKAAQACGVVEFTFPDSETEAADG